MYEIAVSTETGLECKTTSGNAYTLGSYQSEEESAVAFDSIVGRHQKWWKVEEETWGQMMQPMPGCNKEQFRIDRILIPTSEFIKFGWDFGAIGIEIKNSGEKVGRPVCQCIDYRRCVFTLKSGYAVVLKQIFVWPFTHTGGDIECVMGQNRIGGVFHRRENVDFYLGQQLVLRVDRDSAVREFKRKFIADLGKKAGNRG